MNDYSLYGINVNSKAFKQAVRDLKAKPKKKQAFKSKVKNARNKLTDDELLEVMADQLGIDVKALKALRVKS